MRQDIHGTNVNVRRSIMNLEKLAVSDEEMIKLQRKTIYVQQLELDQFERQMTSHRRSYKCLADRFAQQ